MDFVSTAVCVVENVFRFNSLKSLCAPNLFCLISVFSRRHAFSKKEQLSSMPPPQVPLICVCARADARARRTAWTRTRAMAAARRASFTWWRTRRAARPTRSRLSSVCQRQRRMPRMPRRAASGPTSRSASASSLLSRLLPAHWRAVSRRRRRRRFWDGGARFECTRRLSWDHWWRRRFERSESDMALVSSKDAPTHQQLPLCPYGFTHNPAGQVVTPPNWCVLTLLTSVPIILVSSYPQMIHVNTLKI